MKLNVKLTLLSLIPLLLWSCGPDSELPPPDITSVRAPVELVRFDRALMQLDTGNLAAGMADLDANYPEFSAVYFRHIIPLRRGDLSPEEQQLALKAFMTYPLILEIDSIVQSRFSEEDLEAHRADLEQALRYYKYYLPDAPRPDTLLTFFSQFELAAVLYGTGNLAVGLDFFLGPDFDYQSVDPRETIFSNYLARTYTPEHMTAKLMRALIEDLVQKPRGGRLLDHLIYEGKKLFMLDRVLPFTPDSILQEVTAAQMDWLTNNEVQIYAYLQEEKYLYSTDPVLIRKYTQPSPSTQGMPSEAPGQAVNYLGRKIVEAYVKANPRVTMEELLAMQDGQEILAGARYKPR